MIAVEFESIYAETMKNVDAQPDYFFDHSYFDNLRDLRGARTYLATASIDDHVAAAAIFFEVGGFVQYHLSGSRAAYRHRQPTKFLLDEIRRWAADQGHHTLHLGGGLGGREDSLFRFKAGFSKRRHDFHTWQIVPEVERYSDLCSSTGSNLNSSFFPAYRSEI